jgi:hypothetical protein
MHNNLESEKRFGLVGINFGWLEGNARIAEWKMMSSLLTRGQLSVASVWPVV